MVVSQGTGPRRSCSSRQRLAGPGKDDGDAGGYDKVNFSREDCTTRQIG
jgi:hypothetical protein